MNVVLASASPRRRELMEMLGVENLKILPARGEDQKILYLQHLHQLPAPRRGRGQYNVHTALVLWIIRHRGNTGRV